MNLPAKFGRYEVRGTVGKGAMGLVYLAVDPVIGREVAIKVITPQPGLDREEQEERQARFEREFRAAGTLSHPNIVTIHDVGREGEASFLAMEYIQGESLQAVMRSGQELTLDRVADTLLQLARGLDYAHRRGIIHRDIKPANILLTPDGQPKITDFGVAKEITATMTRTGIVLGTPAYMSPEQVTGQPVSGASDQFSLAVLYYEILTGRRPFGGEITTTLLYKIVHDDPPLPSDLNGELPPAVDAALLKALSKQPGKRYPSCVAMVEAVGAAFVSHSADLSGALPRHVRDEDAGSHSPTVRSDSTLLRHDPSPVPGRLTASYSGVRSRRWVVVSLLVAVGVLGLAGWLGLQPEGFLSGLGENLALNPPAAQTWQVEVVTEPGATILVDDQDEGPTPKTIELVGRAGESHVLQLRREGEVVAEETIRLGPSVPGRWEPNERPVPLRFQLSSDPPGARLTLDGEVRGETPVEVPLMSIGSQEVTLELAGYESRRTTLAVSELSAEERASRSIEFAMQRAIPPAHVVVRASFPLRITTAGRTFGPSSTHDLSLKPGSHRLDLTAPEVFFQRTDNLQVASGESYEISVPRTVTVRIAANPSNCEVGIDGRPGQATPFDQLLAVGRHRLRFAWPGSGQAREIEVIADRDGQRIFESE